jgi:hypothetical protein
LPTPSQVGEYTQPRPLDASIFGIIAHGVEPSDVAVPGDGRAPGLWILNLPFPPRFARCAPPPKS